MKKINKLSNLSINYIRNLYKVMLLLKVNKNLYVIYLLNTWMKLQVNLFHKFEHETKFFQSY